MPRLRRTVYLPVVAVALLAIGAEVATGVSGALGLSFTPTTAPAEHPRAVDAGRGGSRLHPPPGQKFVWRSCRIGG